MTTILPAVVRASTIRDLLAAVGATGLPSRYTVRPIGIHNRDTGSLIECDTAPFYQAFGANPDEGITLGDTTLTIVRGIVVHNDLND